MLEAPSSVQLARLEIQLNQERRDHQQTRDHLHKIEESFQNLEAEAYGNQEKAALATARIDDLQSQITYLKEQLQLYQVRMGLIQPTKSLAPVESVPIARRREPFAVASARVQADMKEKYWRDRADAAEKEITGKTSNLPTPSTDTGE